MRVVRADATTRYSYIWVRDDLINDRYRHPGTPLLRPLPGGGRVLWQHGSYLFLAVADASRTGD